MSFSWFIVQCNTNAEKTAQKNLLDRIKRFEAEKFFGDILVPTQDVVEMKNGQKKKSERKLFPGYMFVQVETDEGVMGSEAWHIVRETPKVTGFIGGTVEKPLPMTATDVDRMLARVQTATDTVEMKNSFTQGQWVRITEGPFVNFTGVVEAVDPVHDKVRVAVLVFGRPTPVDFNARELVVTEKDVEVT